MRVRCSIRRIRESRGLALREVARRTGIAPGALSLIETGHQLPTRDQARQLARALDTTVIAFWPTRVLDALVPDDKPRACATCGQPLPLDARQNRRHHNGCRRHERTRP